MDETSTRSTPLLRSQPRDQSLDKMDLHLAPPRALPSHTSQTALVASRPRPEIILRWKRFALLVVLGASIIAALTVTLYLGIPLTNVHPDDAEQKVELFNSYSGVFMGFVESGVSQLLGYLFPVFIVYLHNLKWSRLDDPATRPISKFKKISLLLFIPIVMVAIGNSLSAVQTNQSGADEGASKRQRHLLETTIHVDGPSALDETLFKSVDRGVQGLDQVDASSAELYRVAAGARVQIGFPLRDWQREMELPSTAGQDETVQVTRVDHGNVRRTDAIVSSETSVDLLVHGLTMFKQLAKDQGMDLPLPTTFEALTLSQTSAELLEAVSRLLGSTFNASEIAMTLSSQQLHAHVQLQSLMLDLPVATTNQATVSCGRAACVAPIADPLVRLRSLVAASQFSPACPSGEFSKCETEQNAAFLYSSSTSSAARSSHTVESSITLTFSKLTWAFEDTSLELCSPSEAHASPACTGLTLELPHSRRHLILNALLFPSASLPSSPSQPLRLVQIVQPAVVDRDNKLATIRIMDENRVLASTDRHDIGAVDHFVSFLHENRLYGDHKTMASTLRATALLFLFQNAVVTAPASSPTVAWQRHLVATATTKEFQVYAANTNFGTIATWVASGMLFLLSALVLVLPNARARLEPPKGGNARAERFISVQTEEVYPNLVYKKRFRIGKTGEKIKFREFAVEAVTLHHKMEEDEQIEL